MKLRFRVHALQRMFQRRILQDEVRQVLMHGEDIERYPNDTPYPSRLILGHAGQRPLHIVVADDMENGETIVVTVYEPDPARWSKGFRTRRTEGS